MRKKVRLKVAAGVAVSVLIIGTSIFMMRPQSIDSQINEGSLPTLTEQEVEDKMNRLVEEGTFNVAIASEIYLDSMEYEGKADIQNIANNHYDLSVQIILNDSEQVVYESEVMKPNTYIEHIKLKESLEDGSHDAVAVFTAYDSKSGDVVGNTNIAVILKVINQI